MDNNENVVLTTLLQIKEQIGALDSATRAMDSKLDDFKSGLTAHFEQDKTEHQSQNEKIKELEDSQKKVKWVAIGAGAVITLLWKVAEAMGLWFNH